MIISKLAKLSALTIPSILGLISCTPLVNPETDGWAMYRGGFDGTGYSTLDKITLDNVGDLSLSWRYSLSATTDSGLASANSQATPIVVNNTLYVPTADRVVALNPVSGEEIWSLQVSGSRPSRRGVAFWPGTESAGPRILFTAGTSLIAADALTGEPVMEFGSRGIVDLVIPYNSVPLIYDNIVVVGANTPAGAPGGIGNARAYNAQDGRKLWEFASVPGPGNAGNDSWEGDSWRGRLGANAWPFYFTVDEDSELLYLPLASPLPFAYGGDRGGDNLFANSIVAVNVRTGEYAWHFQTIHHDLWDHDPPAPPTLFDIRTEAGLVPALGVTTKSGYLYILNRNDGTPLYGVNESPVPQSSVPGEQTSPTQPVPLRPPALAKTSFRLTDIVTAQDTSEAHATACAELMASMGSIINQGPFTPWVYRQDPSSGPVTLLFPGLTGGPNWGGVAYNPANQYAYVFATDVGTFGWMEDAEPGADYPYVRNGPRPANFDVDIGGQRLPCQKPPWGRLSAVDTTTGNLVWQRTIGISEVLPAGRQRTGRPGRASAIVTAGGLLFIAATDDNRLRALDASTGMELWSVELESRGNANPMTFRGNDGKQYIVIAATEELIAFSL